jgi:hypothetical protein
VTTINVIGSHAMIKQADDVVSCDLEGETALMSVAQGKYYGLDPIGSRIWGLLATPRRMSEICTVLLQEYEVEPGRCEQDVQTLLNHFLEANLIEIIDGPGK